MLPATITVVSAVDDATIDSLRAAITSLNAGADANPDVAANRTGAYGDDDRIEFDIPGPGVRSIHLTAGLPAIDRTMTIDGYSQPGASANTLAAGDDARLLIEIDGEGAGKADGLTIRASGTVVRGLVINRFKADSSTLGYGMVIQADNVLVRGNFIGTTADGTAALGNDRDGIYVRPGSSDNTIGGTTPGARNLISGNWLRGISLEGTGTDRNRIEGNFIGTDVTGTYAIPNHGWGMELRTGFVDFSSGPRNNTVGGTASGARNIISGNGGYGVILGRGGTSETLIAGNYIGTDVTGTVAIANSITGISVSGAVSTTIGGTTPGAGNIISGNSQWGIEVSGNGTRIVGNAIGTDVTGTAPIPNLEAGLLIYGADPYGEDLVNYVGGRGPGEGNIIAFNGKGVIVGVSPRATATYAAVLGNSIFGNTLIGIDLADDGATPNGVNPRAFPNNGQNYPVIESAGGVRVAGTLNSVPDGTFLLQFFANPPGTSAQGKMLLGSYEVHTDSGGLATFDATLDRPLPPGWSLTSTATDKQPDDTFGMTSEFSAPFSSAVVVSPASLPTPTVGNRYLVTLTAAGGSGGPYTFAVTAGALPAGLSLDRSSGNLSGTPTTPGPYAFTVTATGIGGDTGPRSYSGAVNARISVSPDTLPATTVASPFQMALTAAGGTGGPYTFAVTAGALPAGLSLASSTGVLSGTPTTAGAYAFTVTATASGGDAGAQDYLGVVNPAIVIGPDALPPLAVGDPFSTVVVANGGSQGPYTIALTDGALPEGLSLDASSGLIHGTPTAAGAYRFTLTATARGGDTGRRVYSGVVNDAAEAPTVLGLSRYGYHLQPTRLVLTFSTALERTRAEDVRNYTLVSLTRAGRPSRRFALLGASYDAASRSVTLRPDRRVPLHGRYQLTVNGHPPAGLTSARGALLDGDGAPGSDYVRAFGRDILAGPSRISPLGVKKVTKKGASLIVSVTKKGASLIVSNSG